MSLTQANKMMRMMTWLALSIQTRIAGRVILQMRILRRSVIVMAIEMAERNSEGAKIQTH